MSHARSRARGTCGQQSRCAAKGKASSVSTIIPVDEDSNMQSAPTPAAKRKGIQWEKNYSLPSETLAIQVLPFGDIWQCKSWNCLECPLRAGHLNHPVPHHANAPMTVRLLSPLTTFLTQWVCLSSRSLRNVTVLLSMITTSKWSSSDIWSRDLKVRNAKDKWEHAKCLAEQDFMHKCDLMCQQLEQTKLKLELACACQEEEETRIQCIAMEQGGGLNN